MTFNPIAAKSAYDCLEYIDSKNPIALDLGSQTCTIGKKFLSALIKANKISSEKILRSFSMLQKKNSFNTKEYFSSIGYHDYQSIDINGAYDSHEFDLNLDIRKIYNFKKEYDLVINNGTGEHVFNQANLYLNFHNLTKTNGIMLNILPFIDWINHGFYNYNPIFFGDLAAANNYEIVKLTMANRDGAELLVPQKYFENFYDQIKPHQNSYFKEIITRAKENLGQNILLVVILQKKSSAEFITPLQGKYLSDIKSKNTNYKLQKKGSALAEGQIADNKKRE